MAQGITFLASIALARIFTSEDFGVFGVFMSFTSIISPVIALRYDNAIPLPAHADKAKKLLIVSILVTASLASLLILLAILNQNTGWLFSGHNLNENRLLILVPVFSLVWGMYHAWDFWLVRIKKFGKSSWLKIIQSSGVALGSIGLGLAGMSTGMIWGYVGGNIVVSLVSISQSIRHGIWKDLPSWKEMKETMREFAIFPFQQAGPVLINSISLWLPIIIINFHYDDATTGYYSLVRQVLSIPLFLASMAVSKVLFQDLADKVNQGKNLTPRINNVMIANGVIGVLALGVVFFAFEPVFLWIYGADWEPSVAFGLIMIFSIVVKFIFVPGVVLLTVLKKLKIAALWQGVHFLILVSFYFVETDFMTFLKGLVLAESVIYLLIGGIVWFQARAYDRNLTNAATRENDID